MSNYFTSRSDAGLQLADQLKDLRFEDTVILAVSEGAVIVGAQIAAQLHSLITLLLSKDIVLPDARTVIGVVNEQGGFAHNDAIPVGTVEELALEYRGHIEHSKSQAMHDMHSVLGSDGLIEKQFFRNKTVIIVSDGARSGVAYDMAKSFLHDVATNQIIMVAPVVSPQAVDRMHISADRIEVLRVTPEYYGADHYYEDNQLPTSKEIYNYLHNIIMHWHNINT